MSSILDKIIGDIAGKKEWRAMVKRSKALPHDYQIAYKEIMRYIWSSTGVTTIEPIRVLLDLFEESAAGGRDVLEITGNDVAAFCDDLVKGEETYFKKYREKLNQNVANKLKK